MYEDRFMRRAIEISCEALGQAGAAPFGAVVVKDGDIVGQGVNLTGQSFDPTAHGEIEAIRDAACRLGSSDLSGCELYTSCEPCALCVAAMHLAGIRAVYYAASITDAAAIVQPFMPGLLGDVEQLRRESSQPAGAGQISAEQRLGGEALPALKAWAASRV